MPLDITTIDGRMDAALEANIERLARAALVDIRKMVVFARRSIGQRTRFARQRIASTINDARI